MVAVTMSDASHVDARLLDSFQQRHNFSPLLPYNLREEIPHVQTHLRPIPEGR